MTLPKSRENERGNIGHAATNRSSTPVELELIDEASKRYAHLLSRSDWGTG